MDHDTEYNSAPPQGDDEAGGLVQPSIQEENPVDADQSQEPAVPERNLDSSFDANASEPQAAKAEEDFDQFPPQENGEAQNLAMDALPDNTALADATPDRSSSLDATPGDATGLLNGQIDTLDDTPMVGANGPVGGNATAKRPSEQFGTPVDAAAQAAPLYDGSIGDPMALDPAPDMSMLPPDATNFDDPFLEPAAPVSEPEAPRIQAFAKLEFDDGQFYMNTYSVELGRDIRAARLAVQKDKDQETSQPPAVNGKRRSSSGADGPHTPTKLIKWEEPGKMGAPSVISETGGIMGVDAQDTEKRRKKKSKKAKSTSSSSQHLSRKDSSSHPNMHTDYQSLAMASLADNTGGPHPVDPMSLLPSPDECPLIPIHPPTGAAGGAAGHKGISRKHVKIAYNFDKHLFEVEIKGKNGAFVDEQWYGTGEIKPLKSGSYIQIGGVGVRFVLPEVPLGETGAEDPKDAAAPPSGNKMSFEFENGRGESVALEESSAEGEEIGEEDESDKEGAGSDEGEEDDGEDKSQAADEEIPLDSLPPEVKKELMELPFEFRPVKRKGPGRPPKNGIISKRELKLREKEAKLAALRAAQEQGLESPTKGKIGTTPRKDSNVELSPNSKPQKRKYTKRKGLDQPGTVGEAIEIQPTLEGSIPIAPELELLDAQPLKEKKPPKPPKPVRSPSPVFDESQLTPEQLAKPQASYVVLIHEALSNSKSGPMSLPQIYRAIERKYPFYKLRVQTNGWQSSVRHNLSQHHAFQKVERDGKGWLWGIVPGVSIEKEKKRKLSPPPPPPHHYLQQQPMMRPPGYPLGYQNPSAAPGMMNHLQPGIAPGIAPGGQPPGPAAAAPQPSQHPTYPAVQNPLQPSNPQFPPARPPGTYTSPYAQRPSQPQQQAAPPPPPAAQPAPPPQPSPHSGANGYYANTGRPSQPNVYAPQPQAPAPAAQPQPPVQARPAPPPQPPAQQSSRPRLTDDILQAVGKFKTALVSQMNDKVRGELIVTSAINRTLGIQDKSSVPGKEDPQEAAIMKALAGMLEAMGRKAEAARHQPPPAQPQQQYHQPHHAPIPAPGQQQRPAPPAYAPPQQQAAQQSRTPQPQYAQPAQTPRPQMSAQAQPQPQIQPQTSQLQQAPPGPAAQHRASVPPPPQPQQSQQPTLQSSQQQQLNPLSPKAPHVSGQQQQTPQAQLYQILQQLGRRASSSSNPPPTQQPQQSPPAPNALLANGASSPLLPAPSAVSAVSPSPGFATAQLSTASVSPANAPSSAPVPQPSAAATQTPAVSEAHGSPPAPPQVAPQSQPLAPAPVQTPVQAPTPSPAPTPAQAQPPQQAPAQPALPKLSPSPTSLAGTKRPLEPIVPDQSYLGSTDGDAASGLGTQSTHQDGPEPKKVATGGDINA